MIYKICIFYILTFGLTYFIYEGHQKDDKLYILSLILYLIFSLI